MNIRLGLGQLLLVWVVARYSFIYYDIQISNILDSNFLLFGLMPPTRWKNKCTLTNSRVVILLTSSVTMASFESADRISRHAAINSIIVLAFTSARIPAVLELTDICCSDGKRPDHWQYCSRPVEMMWKIAYTLLALSRLWVP